ncbi:unnamed protein product [Cylicocyclus nassatus]|uniref:SHSP domain-containing protein n=1 Tax=Cylicocyclus nassatus TaxID=53992 RepID=A0AA36GRI4_CYLNA|nr:unnamed protein product [Cylicocyclus nassatus]
MASMQADVEHCKKNQNPMRKEIEERRKLQGNKNPDPVCEALRKLKISLSQIPIGVNATPNIQTINVTFDATTYGLKGSNADKDFVSFCASSTDQGKMDLWRAPRIMNRMMNEMLREFDRFDRPIYPYWREADHSVLHVANETQQVVDDDTRFAVSLDVSQFRPEELNVHLDGRELTVEGKQEHRGDNSYLQRSFIRKWTLPESVNLEAVRTELSDRGLPESCQEADNFEDVQRIRPQSACMYIWNRILNTSLVLFEEAAKSKKMSYWHMHQLMDRIMDDYMRAVGTRDDRGIVPYWPNVGRSILEDANQAHQVVNDDEKFAVSIDVSQFKPEELKVNLRERVVTVEGKQECKDEHSFMARSFVRSWTLPDDVNVEELHSELNDRGQLIIEAPKNESTSERKDIPITRSRSRRRNGLRDSSLMHGAALLTIEMCLCITAAACHYDSSGFSEGFVSEIPEDIVKRAEDFFSIKLASDDIIVKMDVHERKGIKEYLLVGLVKIDALHVAQFEQEENRYEGKRTELATMLSKIIDCTADGPLPKLEHLLRFIH